MGERNGEGERLESGEVAARILDMGVDSQNPKR